MFSINSSKKSTLINEDTPSHVSYKRAVELCGSYGIFDLRWHDFGNGEIESVYCKR